MFTFIFMNQTNGKLQEWFSYLDVLAEGMSGAC